MFFSVNIRNLMNLYYFLPPAGGLSLKDTEVWDSLNGRLLSGVNDFDYWNRVAGIHVGRSVVDQRPEILSVHDEYGCKYPEGNRFLELCKLTKKSNVPWDALVSCNNNRTLVNLSNYLN